MDRNEIKNKLMLYYSKEYVVDKYLDLKDIINELEKDLEDMFYGRGQHFMDSSIVPIEYVLDKLQELKENKNENKEDM